MNELCDVGHDEKLEKDKEADKNILLKRSGNALFSEFYVNKLKEKRRRHVEKVTKAYMRMFNVTREQFLDSFRPSKKE